MSASVTIHTPAMPSTAGPAWLHWWAVLTVVAALPLLLLGAEVTSLQAGMVDPEGLRVPWHILLVQAAERGLGYFIEHGHRTAGWIVGVCVIVLAVRLWTRPQRLLRWLGIAALAGVILQGVLGILRVKYNALAGREVALIHGCFAQLVFATLVSIAWLTSQGAWVTGEPADASRRFWSLALPVVVYLQIICGALVRHTESLVGPRAHLLLAFGVVAVVARLVAAERGGPTETRKLSWSVKILVGLLVLQLLLGVEAWLGKFVGREWVQLRPLPDFPKLVRSLHFLVGALIFSTSVVVALRVRLRGVDPNPSRSDTMAHLEGTA
jgi:cytochrome c oxidase assembly protein subunit 15